MMKTVLQKIFACEWFFGAASDSDLTNAIFSHPCNVSESSCTLFDSALARRKEIAQPPAACVHLRALMNIRQELSRLGYGDTFFQTPTLGQGTSRVSPWCSYKKAISSVVYGLPLRATFRDEMPPRRTSV